MTGKSRNGLKVGRRGVRVLRVRFSPGRGQAVCRGAQAGSRDGCRGCCCFAGEQTGSHGTGASHARDPDCGMAQIAQHDQSH